MSSAAIARALQEMRASQQAIGAACDARAGEWRHDVVHMRRQLAEQVRRIAELLNDGSRSAAPQDVAFRNALSKLRSALAEHQASWPAVSLEPASDAYRASVELVRSAFTDLERAFTEAESRSGRNANGDKPA